ncbi:MAG TPA: DUF4395 family protein [Gemmatimonadales bacterium]|jgi:hypothetical protein
MPPSTKLNFVRQQGYPQAQASTCPTQYSALMFQPRVIAILALIGLVSQWPVFFLVLAAVLAWNVILPAWNPFDALYNRLIAIPRGLPLLTPAPPPRRFAQGMACAFMLAIGLSLLAERRVLAWVFEGALVIALSSLVFGKFCLGSYIYHLVRGERTYAQETLPWSRSK